MCLYVTGCPALPPGCILERILSVQKLDDLDIEGLRPHYEAVAKRFKQIPVTRFVQQGLNTIQCCSNWFPCNWVMSTILQLRI